MLPFYYTKGTFSIVAYMVGEGWASHGPVKIPWL